MIGIVSRLTDQKGFDLIDYVIEEICAEDTQLVVLGTGEEKYEKSVPPFCMEISGPCIGEHLLFQ